MTAIIASTHYHFERGGAVLGLLALLVSSSVQAAGVSVGASAGVGHSGVSAGVSAGNAGVSASAGRSGANVGASTSASASAAGASASAGVSAGVGGRTGIGATASVGASTGVGTTTSGVAGSASTSAGVSHGVAGVGLGVGVGVGVATAAGNTATTGSSSIRGQNNVSQVVTTIQPVDAVQADQFYALQRLPDPEAVPYLQGPGSLRPDYLIRCSSWFCRSHLLGQAGNAPINGRFDRRPAGRYGTFDAVIVAAEAGNPNAEFMVAEVLAGGHGVPANPRRAATWYTRAAQHGNTLAVSRLNRLRAAIADRE